MFERTGPDSAVFRRWLASLRERDPRLHAELQERLAEREARRPFVPETVDEEGPGLAGGQDLVLETIVREGRPAILIARNKIGEAGPELDAASREIAGRLTAAASVVNPLVPLVGRIDLANHARLSYAGTGWLVDTNIVVTNRHVAEILARRDGAEFRFRPGRFGEDLAVGVDYLREFNSTQTTAVRVTKVIWIEEDDTRADIAFLEVERRTDGANPPFIPLSDSDGTPNSDVVVIGYPARATVEAIPDQRRMDELYRGIYDVKRIAPGLLGARSRGWATHDCTTLGGNSGSVVLDMKTGRAVGLHFAGLYMIENYAVPASVVRQYLKSRPWHPNGRPVQEINPPPPDASTPPKDRDMQTTSQEVTVPITLKITVSVGQPQLGSGGGGDGGAARRDTPSSASIEEAAGELLRTQRVEGVLAVRPSYVISGDIFTDTECLAVAAHPERMAAVRAAMPASFRGFPVEVRVASIWDQAAATSKIFDEAVVTSVAYDDENRTGEGFSFDEIDEPMQVLLHVGPERSWSVLSDFLGAARRELVSSMYEFHAEHIADAIEDSLGNRVELQLVLGAASRDPRSGNPPKPGDFDRSRRFDRWEQRFGNNFERIFVPQGSEGLVANSYHIKVTVRDRDTVWLSSGNWKQSSQPVIADGDLNNPAVTSEAGNREWHVVITNQTLATRLRNHILADLERSRELGGTPEAVEDQILVDVPETLLEGVVFEAPAATVLQPKNIDRRVRVKPLLTPDKKGAVYSKAVLQLIRSARNQLLFQIPYIKGGVTGGFLDQLIDAIVAKADEIDDVKILLRADFLDIEDVAALKRRGLDVNRLVRRVDKTHTKGMVVDGERVLVGSHNWSASGVTLNRDASLIFHDREIAEYYRDAFFLDWRRARRFSLESVLRESAAQAAQPRIAVGDAPPPGFKRMTLTDYLEG